MWYSGGTGNMQDGIGFATSSDGITWTRQPRIFYKTDGYRWRSTRTYCPMVIRTSSGYKMWYAGMYDNGTTKSYSIGYATGDNPTAVMVTTFTARAPANSAGLWLGMIIIGGVLGAAAWCVNQRRRGA